jgi:hypothetical protein
MPTDENIKTVCDRIIKDFRPLKVILFNIKHSPSGEATGFKLCVVMDTADKTEDEKRIYLDIDCDIPFDVLIYSPQEWDGLMLEKHSFAKRILREGTYIYGSDPS